MGPDTSGPKILPTPSGLRTLYAGKGMTMWETREEAQASWSKSSMDLLERSAFPWWRADRVVTVDQDS